VGTSGAGKTTLASFIAQHYQVRHIELDAIGFAENWVKRSDEDFIQRVQEEIKKGPYVLCGNYKDVQALVMDQIDWVIWLDYRFSLVFWRVVKRTMTRLFTREKCCGDNYESWVQQFCTKYSIFWWVILSFSKNRARYLALSLDPDHRHRVIRLCSPRELEIFQEMVVSNSSFLR
jgi:adenylate kinase family enzyme